MYGTTRRELCESTDRETSTVTRGKEQTGLGDDRALRLKNGNTKEGDIIVARRSPKSFFGDGQNTPERVTDAQTLITML